MDYRDTMRRILAALAFRTRHAFKNPPQGFEDFEAGMDARTPHLILHHINECISTANDRLRGREPQPLESLSFMETVETFHLKLLDMDKSLTEADLPDDDLCLRLIQGHICDAMTHVGQLMMLRRLMGSAISGTNYFRADIQSGRVGPDQPLPED